MPTLFTSPLIVQGSGTNTFLHGLGKVPEIVMPVIVANAQINTTTPDTWLKAAQETPWEYCSDTTNWIAPSLIVTATLLIVATNNYQNGAIGNLIVWDQTVAATTSGLTSVTNGLLKVYLIAL